MEDGWDLGSAGEGSSGSLGEGSDGEGEAASQGAQPAEFYDPQADDRDEAWVQKMRRSHRSDAILSCPLCFTTLCIDCQQHEEYDNQFRAMFVMNCRVKTGEVVTPPPAPGKEGKQQRKQRRQQERQAAADRQQRDQQGDAAAAGAGEQAGDVAGQQQAGSSQPPPAGQEQPVPDQVLQPRAQPQPGPGGAGAAEVCEEQLNPVCCAVCDTEVGLRDVKDGVYVFFNAFASNS